MLEATVVEPGKPVRAIARATGQSVSGLRLLDGVLVLKVQRGRRVEQIRILEGDSFDIAVSDGDTVLVPRGHYPCDAPYGYDMYYLNAMAGPKRQWCFRNHPDHDWIYRRDSGS